MVSIPKILSTAGFCCRFLGGCVALAAAARGVNNLALGLITSADYAVRGTALDTYGAKPLKNFLGKGNTLVQSALGYGFSVSFITRDDQIGNTLKSGALSITLSIGILYLMNLVSVPAPIGSINKALRFTPIQLSSCFEIPFLGGNVRFN